MDGLLHLHWWGYIVATLILTQLTIFSVTIFLHRCQAHRALELHPVLSHFFRFWLWLTTGMVTKEWASIHRKHHAKVETVDDPHSPITKGIWTVVLEGAELYRKESRNKTTMERYGQGTPDDWMERHVYSRHTVLGIASMLVIDLLLFGTLGLTIWAIQMAWIPFFAAGVINGIGHYWGYRNFETADTSTNIIPWGLFVGGEELHNNHHTYGTSAKFSIHWWEIDLGWLLIRLFMLFGLAKPKRLPPKAKRVPEKRVIDVDTIKAVLMHRFQIMSEYSRHVVLPVLRDERKRAGAASRSVLHKVRKALVRDVSLVNADSQAQLTRALEQHRSLNSVYQLRLQLQHIWAKSAATPTELVDALQEWCKKAEATGIKALHDFVKHLKSITPQRV